MAGTFRIKFNPSAKEIEVEGSEAFVKKYFEILRNLISESGLSSKEPAQKSGGPGGAKKVSGAIKGKTSKTGTVIDLIQRSKGGITTAELEEKSGLSDKQIWSIIYKAEKEGKIKKARRGVYVAK